MSSNPFSTPSTLLASWILFSERNPYLGYRDGRFWFDDPEFLIQFLIGGYHDINPQANIHRFERCKSQLISDKLRGQK